MTQSHRVGRISANHRVDGTPSCLCTAPTGLTSDAIAQPAADADPWDYATTLCNQNGQKLGAKGARTRQRLIDATIGLLETVGLRDATVAQVAKVAGTSSATFYVYFEGVAEVVLAALESAEQVTDEMMALLEGNWSGPLGDDLARRFVQGYVSQWQKHRTVFRVRNLAGEEGDARFVEARYKLVRPLVEVLAGKIARARLAAGLTLDVEPTAIAGTLLIMLERLGAVAPITADGDGMNGAGLIAAAAWFLHSALVPCPGARALLDRPFDACTCPVADAERERILSRADSPA